MGRWKVWLGITVLFLSGAAIGVMGTVIYVHHHIRSIISEGPEAFNRMIMLHLDHELDLTGEQEDAVFNIITDTHNRLLDFRSEHDSEIHAIIDEGVRKIKEHLQGDQLSKVDELIAEIHSGLHKESPHPYGDEGEP